MSGNAVGAGSSGSTTGTGSAGFLPWPTTAIAPVPTNPAATNATAASILSLAIRMPTITPSTRDITAADAPPVAAVTAARITVAGDSRMVPTWGTSPRPR